MGGVTAKLRAAVALFVWAAVSLVRAQVVAQELGPAPTDDFGGATGRVSAVVCSPTNPGLYYAAGADGGVWRSDDAGASWRALTDFQITTAMGALALDPTDDQVVYAGTGEANFANHSRPGEGILKSTDGGLTWRLLGRATFSGRCISRIVVSPADTRVMYASVTHAGGFPALAAAKGHPGANGAVGVFKSVDGGDSWSQLSGGLPALDATDLAIDRGNPSVVFAAVGAIFGSTSNGIYKSIDGGATWGRLNGGLPAASATVGRIGVAAAASNGQRLYATVMHAANEAGNGATLIGSYRSSDGGATWTPILSGLNPSDYGWYFTTIGVHPSNPDVVFMAAIDPRYSVNAGGSFATGSGSHPDFHSVAWDAAGRMVVGCDGGVYRSADGLTFQGLNTGLGTAQLYPGLSVNPADPNVIFAGLQDNGTARRGGDALLWRSVAGGDGGWTQIDPFNANRVYAESQGTGALYVSTDGGFTFGGAGAGLSGRNCFEPPFLMDPGTPGRMLYGTERVWVSGDYGANWSPLSADVTGGGNAAIRCLAIAPTDSSRVYAATNDGRVLASTDFGATFQVIRTGNPGWPRLTHELTVDPANPDTVILAVSGYGGGHVLSKTSGQPDWTELGAGLPDLPVNVVAISRQTNPPNIYAGTEAGLYLQTGEGPWRRVAGIPSVPVTELALSPSGLALVIGTQGRGAWSLSPVTFCIADFNGDGDVGTDADIAAFFACLGGSCCATCGPVDFNGDGDIGTDGDIESFFRVLAGGSC